MLKERRNELYILLEYGCKGAQAVLIDRLFFLIRPADEASSAMAAWLISWSVKQRYLDRDVSGALASLDTAEAILRAKKLDQSLDRSNLCYRKAVCFLDLGWSAEAAPLLRECLSILSAHGGADSTPNMMTTRNTYAVALQISGQSEAALREYQALTALYREQERQHSAQYAVLQNNIAVLLDQSGRYEEAAQAIRTVLDIDGNQLPPPDVSSTHLRNAALIFAHLQQYDAAEPLAESACELRRKHFGEDSPWTADAKAVHALALFYLGQQKKAALMIEEACKTLENAWGREHRHTVNALQIKSVVRSDAR